MKYVAIVVGLHGVFDSDNEKWHGIPNHLTADDLGNQLNKSLEYAKQNEHSCLILSGGNTRKDFSDLNEAETALQFLCLRHGSVSNVDVVLEKFARDSAENLFFGILAAREHYRVMPHSIRFVSFCIKESRMAAVFSGLNLRIPYEFIGIKPRIAVDAKTVKDWKQQEEINLEKIRLDPTQRFDNHFLKKRLARTNPIYSINATNDDDWRYLDLVKSTYTRSVSLIDQWKETKRLEW